jgi:hypothetical protein
MLASSSAATCAYGIAWGRRKYVPVGSLLAIHGSQRPAKGHPRPWLPRHEFFEGWLG